MELFLLTRNEQQVVLSNVRRRLTALNVLAVTREHLGALDRVTRIVGLGVAVATFARSCENRRRRVRIASGCFRPTEESLSAGVWRRQCSARHPVELEPIFEVAK